MKTLRRRLVLQSLEARDVPATPGTLDLSFNEVGTLTKPYDEGGNNTDTATASLVLNNGKMFLAAFVENDTGFNAYVTKFNKDGSLDTTFGELVEIDGTARTGTKLVFVGLRATALAAQGSKLVIGGTFDQVAGDTDFIVTRLLRNGDFDQTFGGAGVVILPVDLVVSGADVLNGIAVKGNKIVLAGSAIGLDGDADIAVMQLNKFGLLDPKFGNLVDSNVPRGPRTGQTFLSGSVLNPLEFTAAAVAFQGSKIVVAGTVESFGSLDFLVLRYLPNGDFDLKFNGAGLNTYNLAQGDSNDDVATSLAIQGSKIIVGGDIAIDGVNTAAGIIRIDKFGLLDPTFGGDGIVTFAAAESTRVAVKGSTLYLAGTDLFTATSDFFVVKYDKFGNKDAEFGTVNIDFGESFDEGEFLTGLHVKKGRVTLVGTLEFDAFAGDTDTDVGIARLIA